MGRGGQRAADKRSDVVARLEASPADARRRLLMDWAAARIAAFLGWDGPEDVAPDDHFVDDLGFDSLRAVDFKDVLESDLAVVIRTTALFDQPTPRHLVDWLLNDVLFDESPGDAEPTDGRRPSGEPLAIVGMGCRMPGGVTSPAAFWDLLREGVDAITEIPADRWPVDRLYDPDPAAPGKMSTRYGGFVDEIDRFDAAFFGISPREAIQLDPQHRLLLETTWEAIEHAGIDASSLHGTDAGVFIGMRASEYFDSQCDRGPLDGNQYYATGNAISTAAGRLSYFLGLEGPSLAVDTACSGSLVALQLAARSLRSGECTVALCGGVNANIDPISNISLSKAGMLSPDGRCKTFDASADGYGRAEGCGVIVMKTLARATADGDTVLAVVRGVAINQDGASGGLTVPNGRAQEAVIRAALADGGVDPRDIQYVEAHGTGTPLGDPIELQSLDAVFGATHDETPLVVGSVKTNLGHLEPAAGISGLMKVVLSLQNKEIPAHLHLDNPSSHIPWDELRLTVPKVRRSWDAADVRRAGVSSFGFSGTNAHVVLEEAPAHGVAASALPDPAPVLLKISARTEEARAALVDAWGESLEGDGVIDLAGLAAAANRGRADHPYRLAVMASDGGELARKLRDFREGTSDGGASAAVVGHGAAHGPQVGWMFTGQGAQKPGMARVLYETQPVFRRVLDRCATVFDELRDRPLLSVLWGDDTELLSRTDYTQPALFAVEVALAETWRGFGQQPTAVLGHSVGEYAAACVAGVFDLDAGLRLIAARGGLMQEMCDGGSMIAVQAAEADVADAVGAQGGAVSVAALNGPRSVVVSGDSSAVAKVAAALEKAGVPCTALDVSHGFHSPMMEPMIEAFRAVAESIDYRPPRCPFVSNLTGGVVADEIATADYWVRHIREPVRFADGVGVLAGTGLDVLLEIGPQPTLCSMGRGCVDRRDLQWLPSLLHGQDDREVIGRSLAELWVRGADVDWEGVHAGQPRTPATLPPYPFQRQSYWLERGRSGSSKAAFDVPVHPLRGAPVQIATLQDGEFLFEQHLGPRSPAWISDHRVHGAPIVPAAGFLEMMLAAGRHALGDGSVALLGAVIEAPLVLETEGALLQTVVRPLDDGVDICVLSFDSSSADDGEWVTHASATAVPIDQEAEPRLDGDDLQPSPDAVAGFYRSYDEIGLEYGPAFRAVVAVGGDVTTGKARTRLQVPVGVDVPGCVLHPVLLDAAFQSCAAALGADGFDDAWLPVGVERLTVHGLEGPGATCCVMLRAAEPGARVLSFDLELTDETGRLRVSIEGLQLVRAPRDALLRSRDPVTELLHEVTWKRIDISERERPREKWCVVASRQATARWVAALGVHGHNCVAVAAESLEFDFVALADILGASPVDGVVFVADVDGHAAEASVSRRRALNAALLHTIQAVARVEGGDVPRLVAVTRGAASAGAPEHVDPDHASLWGVMACCALEHPALSPRCVDLPAVASEHEAANAVAAILDDESADSLAIRADGVWTPRLVRGSSSGGPDELVRPAGAFELRASAYGSIANVETRPLVSRSPGPGEIQVQVVAAALNFKDVLFVLGLLEEWSRARGVERAPDQPLGFECAGTIIAVGDGVEGFAPGDRVIATGSGCLATETTLDAGGAAPIPEGVSFEDACALPTVFVTASYALETLAEIAPGERVLVHAAAGGVGQAAIQVAHARGCEVFATASPSKHEHLLDQGVAEVMHSRTLEFGAAVDAATDGRGVDVVLNSLGGEAIATSMAATAKGGRFVDIGKIDAWTADQVAAERPDLSYWNFDLSEVAENDPGLYSKLLRETVARVGLGIFKTPPVTVFELEDARRALSLLASGAHIGKVVVRMQPQPVIRDDRTYLVTGGLGALGLAAAARFVDGGARSLLLLGRSAPTSDRAEMVAALEERGARVRVAAVDVTDHEGIERVVEAAASDLPPIAGVYHTAGVLADGMLINQTADAIGLALEPKARGLEVLSEVLDRRGITPDWWGCTSSMVGLLGAHGQAPYAAANAWMDAWCQRRTARGNRATSIAWGPWAGAGMAASVASRNEVRFAQVGLRAIEPELGQEVLMRVLGGRRSQVAVLPIRWSRWMRQYRGRSPSILDAFHSADTGSTAVRHAILDELNSAAPGDREELLLRFLVEQLAGVLGWDSAEQIESDRSFGELGVDSLLAVDMCNRLEWTFGIPLPATLLFDHPNLQALAHHLTSVITFETSVADERDAGPSAGEAVDDLLELSEEELARRIADQIERLDP